MRQGDRGLTLLLAGLGAALGLAGAAGWASASRAPRIEVSPEVDLGELIYDHEYHVGIGLRNSGSTVLLLQPPRSGCSCAQPELDRSEYAPGQTGLLRVKVQPARPPGTQFEQAVHIPSNDPFEPVKVVLVKGRMEKQLEARPAALRCPDAAIHRPWSEELRISASGGGVPISITGVESDVAGLFFSEPVVMDADGAEHLIQAEYTPSAVGVARGTATVHTSDPKYSRLQIPVDITTPSQLQVSPGSLLFALDDAVREQTVTIQATRPVELTLRSAADEDLGFDAVLTPDTDRSIWRLTVSAPTAELRNSLERTRLQLDVAGLEGESTVEIPVVVLMDVDMPDDDVSQ